MIVDSCCNRATNMIANLQEQLRKLQSNNQQQLNFLSNKIYNLERKGFIFKFNKYTII